MQKMDGVSCHPFFISKSYCQSELVIQKKIATLTEHIAHLPRTAGAGLLPVKRLLAMTTYR